MENKIECIGCKGYYLYFSRKENKYIITNNSLDAFDNSSWISLNDEHISNLVKLLQDHERFLENNKVNLSEQDIKKLNRNPKTLLNISTLIKKL